MEKRQEEKSYMYISIDWLLIAYGTPGSVHCPIKLYSITLRYTLLSYFYKKNEAQSSAVIWSKQSRQEIVEDLNPGMSDPRAHVQNHCAVPQSICYSLQTKILAIHGGSRIV